MKQTNSIQETPSLVKTLFLIALLSVAMSAAQAQNAYVSVQVTRDVTGSGLGGNICPAVSLTKNRQTIAVGPNFQRQHMNFSGFQANYRYSAAKSLNEKFELYFSGNITYHDAARMSRGYEDIEKSCNKENTVDFSNLRLKVMETYAGFGVKANQGKHLSAAAGIGMGMFHTCNKDYDREMYREKSSVALRVNFVLIFHFGKELR